MKDLECPNCAGADPETISAGEFRCKFCGTLFYNEAMRQQKRADDKRAASARANEQRQKAKIEQARATSGMGKRVLLFVGIMLLAIFAFVGYMAKKSMDETNKMQQEMLKNF